MSCHVATLPCAVRSAVCGALHNSAFHMSRKRGEAFLLGQYGRILCSPHDIIGPNAAPGRHSRGTRVRASPIRVPIAKPQLTSCHQAATPHQRPLLQASTLHRNPGHSQPKQLRHLALGQSAGLQSA
ncbi:hypothetical protein VTK56DRAFT_5483 [Thermocarpiscus australiensis]